MKSRQTIVRCLALVLLSSSMAPLFGQSFFPPWLTGRDSLHKPQKAPANARLAHTPARIYVNEANQTGPWNGNSWATAWNSLQEAIEAAQTGDTLWTAGGTYLPDAGTSFEIHQEITLLGGFTGSETHAAQRDPAANPTILKGNGNRILILDRGSAKTTIDGFHFTEGLSDPGSTTAGGAIRCRDASPRITRCQFYDNISAFGGAIAFYNGAPELSYCEFYDNEAEVHAGSGFEPGGGGSGGAIWYRQVLAPYSGSHIVIRHCDFTGNTGAVGGGALYFDGDEYGFTSEIESCRFIQNKAGSGGGGWLLGRDGGSFHARFHDCIFIENEALGLDGGALRLEPDGSGMAVVTNSSFERNKSAASGGAISMSEGFGRFITFINGCRFLENQADGIGGGAYLNAEGPIGIKNCIFIRNTASEESRGGALHFYGGRLDFWRKAPVVHQLADCVFDGNTAGLGGAVFFSNFIARLFRFYQVNCLYHGNSARKGGAISFQWNITQEDTSRTRPLQFINTTFTANQADHGSLLHFEPYYYGSVDDIPPLAAKMVFRNSVIDQGAGNWFSMQGGDSFDGFPELTADSLRQLIAFRNSLTSFRDIGLYSGSYDNITGTHPNFINKSLPAGADDIWGTADDGLIPGPHSKAVNGGNGHYLAGVVPDLAGADRDRHGAFDIGAYETDRDAPFAGRLYVNGANSSDNPDGLSWATAFSRLEAALELASDRDSVWTAQGTYQPAAGTTFGIDANLTMLGGFDGTENEEAQRSWLSNPTILKGNGAGVVRFTGTDSTVALDGFTIRDGQAENGAGVFISPGASATLSDLLITQNTATALGGGIYNDSNSTPWLYRVTVADNRSATAGGAYNNTGSSPHFINSVFRGNKATGFHGGAMSNFGASPRLVNVLIADNEANQVGGGMINSSNARPELTNVTISGNKALNDAGGGIYNSSGSSALLQNSILYGNTADAAANQRNIFNGTGTSASYAYSLVEGSGGSQSWNSVFGTNLGGNLAGNPLFVNAGGGDYRLQAGSPALHKGSKALYETAVGVDAIGTDAGGNPRISGEAIDMGAYEYVCLAAAAEDNMQKTIELAEGPNYLYSGCSLLAVVEPSGATPVSGGLTGTAGVSAQLIAFGNARYAGRYYRLSSAENAENATATITLFYTQEDFDTYNTAFGDANAATLPANLRIAQFGDTYTLDGQEISYEGAPRYITPAAVEWDEATALWKVTFAVSGFSSFFITGQSDEALPVTLVDFQAGWEENTVKLTWQTSSEINVSHFEIQRSQDAQRWLPIGKVLSAGNDGAAAAYTFYDPDVTGTSGKQRYYRLKMTDADGTYSYSRIRSVAGKDNDTVMLYPNPVSGQLHISSAQAFNRYRLTDRLGRTVAEAQSPANGLTTIDLGNLPPGVYVLRLFGQNGKQTTRTIVKTR